MSYELGRNEDEIRSVMDRLKQEGGFQTKIESHASPPDMVNKPPHYQMPGGIETIDYIEAVLAQDYFKTVGHSRALCWKHPEVREPTDEGQVLTEPSQGRLVLQPRSVCAGEDR